MLLVLLVALSGCGDSDDDTGAATTSVPEGRSTSTSAEPAHELIGTREADIQPAAAVKHEMLRLTTTNYRVSREGATGSGRLEIDGEQATFSQSALCSGAGVYRWELDGSTLRFTPVEPDPCTGRAAFLEGATCTRTE